MSGQIIEGKRTLIEYEGHEFELPQGHTVLLVASLNTPAEGSSFKVRECELRDDAVVLHLGEKEGDHGLGTYDDKAPELHGYTFPPD